MSFAGLMGYSMMGKLLSGVGISVAIIAYIYSALVMYTIGKKLKVEPTWLAWIPIANSFYIPMLAGYPWYYAFLMLLSAIPYVGALVAAILTIWWWWKIAERRNFPGWFGILMLIPIVNLIIMGVIAWGEGSNTKKSSKKK